MDKNMKTPPSPTPLTAGLTPNKKFLFFSLKYADLAPY